MQPTFTVTEHHRLLVLYKAIMTVKFSNQALEDPVLAASPFLADMAREVVDTLASIEELEGKPKAREKWSLKIVVGGGTWKIAVRNAIDFLEVGHISWASWSQEKKQELARIFLSPFVVSADIVDAFIKEVDEALNEQ
jgi:hypothetical protein